MSEIAARPLSPTGTLLVVLFCEMSLFLTPYCGLGLMVGPGSRFEATVVFGTLKLMSVMALL